MGADVLYDNFTSISLEIMRLGEIPGFDLYIPGANGPVLYREHQVRFNRENLRSLLEKNVKFLYFTNDDQDLYYSYVENHLNDIVKDSNIAVSKKAAVLYDTSAYLARQMLALAAPGELAQRASAVMDTIIAFTSDGDTSYKDIIEIMPRDYYTHSHCANVATYSLALGREVGLTLDTGLKELTLGALLHDVGKSRVPLEILNKTTALTREEMDIIRKHVDWGMETIRAASAISYKSYPAIAQHHERIDGSGYPAGLSDLHLFGRIVGAADAFDAMTTNRPYKIAMTSFSAVSLLKSMEKQYDRVVVRALVEVMAESRRRVSCLT